MINWQDRKEERKYFLCELLSVFNTIFFYCRQADRQTGRQADRQTGRQADRQTGRQADRQMHKLSVIGEVFQ